MKPLIPVLITLAALFNSCAKPEHPDPEIIMLKCNNRVDPSGVGSNPFFSWIVKSNSTGQRQTAYRIIISSDRESINSGKGNFWDSGRITSAQSVSVFYNGPELTPGEKYFWKVCVWDSGGMQSVWSNTAFFITGLFNCTDWGGARWIGFEELADSLKLIPGVHGSGNKLGEIAKKRSIVPLFRKEFSIDRKIKQALIFVTGIGQYELYVNGKKEGDNFLSPGWTDYSKTCLYNIYDVTEDIKQGSNCIGVIAGNGFFNINRERYRKLVIAYGFPQIILKQYIRFEDGTDMTIVSDETWKSSPSPIVFSGIYGGEDYDARLEQDGWNKKGFDDSKWENVKIVNSPGGVLKAENDFPMRVMQTLKPAKIYNPEPGIYVYDYQQNASGIIRLKVKGRPGSEVMITPGELIDADSLVNQKASGAPYYFSYILKGDKEEIWIPKFTYYGFRYVQVEGAVPEGYANLEKKPVISELDFLHTRNSSPEAGSFSCSSKLFNSIYELIKWSVKSNLASVATDCPHREKLGWLEQTHLMGNSIMYLYDIHNLYNKIIDDMIEAQLDNGLVPDIAPEFVPFEGGFRDSPEWGSACVILPWDLYKWYGDTAAVKKAYPMMKRYLLYLKSKSENNILFHGLGDWYDLGPASPGEAQLTPKALTATAIYFYDNKLMEEMAELTGNYEDTGYYKNMAEKIRISFNRKFFNNETKVYSTGSQTAYSMPLYYGMVDAGYRKDVINNLVSSIHSNNNSLTAGDVGYRYLLRVLEQEGYSQLIYDMNSKTDVPGYGFQLAKGATSLTESWAALKYVSNNHMMLGHLMEWLYSGIGGIKQGDSSSAFKDIILEPQPVGDIDRAVVTYLSVYGEIKCAWKIENSEFGLNVTIPPNCKATIILPQACMGKITCSGKPVEMTPGIIRTEVIKDKTHIGVVAGSYEFRTTYKNIQ
jgi:alpha-L-rhamnosidase